MQKKLLLILTMAVSALVSHAQVKKNDWLLGGYFNFNTSSNSSNNGSNNGSNSGSNSNISPELGWAAGKNSVIGIRGSVYLGTSKGSGGYKSTNHSYLAGAFWKKFFPINEKVGWYGDLTAGYSYSDNQYPDAAQPPNYQKQTGTGFYAAVSPGVYYKAGKKVFLNASKQNAWLYHHSHYCRLHIAGASYSSPVQTNFY